MTARHLCTALAALFLSFLPDSALSGPEVRIRDDQYSGFISGASFTECPGVYTNVNESWTPSGGLSPDFWTSTSGVRVVDAGADPGFGWRSQFQPPVYGRVQGSEYQDLYTWCIADVQELDSWRSSRTGELRSERAAVANERDNAWWDEKCAWQDEFLAEHDPDGSKYHGNWERAYEDVYGAEALDSLWDTWIDEEDAVYSAVDAEYEPLLAAVETEYSERLAALGTRRHLYVAVDTPMTSPAVCRFVRGGGQVQVPEGGEVFFDGLVALELFLDGDLNFPASAIDPEAKLALYARVNKWGEPMLCGALRNPDTGEMQHFAYGIDGGSDSFYVADNRLCGRLVVGLTGRSGGTCDVWVRFGNRGTVYISHSDSVVSGRIPLPVSAVLYSGDVRLGAYTLGRSNPRSVGIGWDDVSDRVDYFDFEGPYYSRRYWYGGGGVVPAAGPVVYEPTSRGAETVSWRGIGGWSDGRASMTLAGGCEAHLGRDVFSPGVAVLEGMSGLADEEVAALEADGLPHADSRIGDRYTNLVEALSHLVCLGGRAYLTASHPGDIVVPPLGDEDVGLDLSTKSVLGGVSASTRSGHPARLFELSDTQPGVSLSNPFVYSATPYTIGGTLSVTGLYVRVQLAEHAVPGGVDICDSPGCDLWLCADNVATPWVHATNSVVTLHRGTFGQPDVSGAETNVFAGGSLYVDGARLGDTVATGVSSVRIAGSCKGLHATDCGDIYAPGDIDRGRRSAVYAANCGSITADEVYATNCGNVTSAWVVATNCGDVVALGATHNVEAVNCASVTFSSGSDWVSERGSLYVVGGGPVHVVGPHAVASLHVEGAESFTLDPGVSAGSLYLDGYPFTHSGGTLAGLDLYNAPTISLEGTELSGSSYSLSGTSVALLSVKNIPYVEDFARYRTIWTGSYYANDHYIFYKRKYTGMLTVRGGSLTIRGGEFSAVAIDVDGAVVIEGSPRFYGNLTISRAASVTIAGDGYFFGELSLPGSGVSVSGGYFYFITAPNASQLVPGKSLTDVMPVGSSHSGAYEDYPMQRVQ